MYLESVKYLVNLGRTLRKEVLRYRKTLIMSVCLWLTLYIFADFPGISEKIGSLAYSADAPRTIIVASVIIGLCLILFNAFFKALTKIGVKKGRRVVGKGIFWLHDFIIKKFYWCANGFFILAAVAFFTSHVQNGIESVTLGILATLVGCIISLSTRKSIVRILRKVRDNTHPPFTPAN